MFNIFKKQQHYDLSWLRVDMHSHILPGIDDGSPDTESSIRYIRGLKELGYDSLFMTPHILPGVHPNDPNTITQSFHKLKEALPEDLTKWMQLGTAAEFMIDLEFDTNRPINQVCLLPDNMILIEMSYLAASPNIDNVIYELQIKGYQPILAHPERYPYYYQDKSHIEQFKDQGCLLQCNLLSFTGYYGKSVQKMAYDIASKGLIDYVGTDLHHDRHLSALQDFYTKNDGRSIFAKCSIQNNQLN
ncbi:MAG: hypothetical protein M9911_14980 [Saprospiraceae bacterium]|nr:hypothetical protein [Saprospiraceae bacterium]